MTEQAGYDTMMVRREAHIPKVETINILFGAFLGVWLKDSIGKDWGVLLLASFVGAVVLCMFILGLALELSATDQPRWSLYMNVVFCAVFLSVLAHIFSFPLIPISQASSMTWLIFLIVCGWIGAAEMAKWIPRWLPRW